MNDFKNRNKGCRYCRFFYDGEHCYHPTNLTPRYDSTNGYYSATRRHVRTLNEDGKCSNYKYCSTLQRIFDFFTGFLTHG